ncbi:hypothetical protein V6N13_067516 [Hibiscus sabdariffa]|uniref:Uncharacterized protein n=1 Tax=Hibiscus sabdariffa TaxID=183260 RepID=A0ABR2DU72_9ROSI
MCQLTRPGLNLNEDDIVSSHRHFRKLFCPFPSYINLFTAFTISSFFTMAPNSAQLLQRPTLSICPTSFSENKGQVIIGTPRANPSQRGVPPAVCPEPSPRRM